MRFNPEDLKCPACEGLAGGTIENLTGTALIDVNTETGEVDYIGETTIDWNDQNTRIVDGMATLVCADCGYHWDVAYLPEMEEPWTAEDFLEAHPATMRAMNYKAAEIEELRAAMDKLMAPLMPILNKMELKELRHVIQHLPAGVHRSMLVQLAATKEG